jgi:ATP-binding cassette, subfamily A (ABC1), member 3
MRTIVLTTHFLDEADLLSDHIAILSKGVLKADGTAVELKHRLGSGYRVHVYNLPGDKRAPHVAGIPREDLYDQTVYNIQDSAQAAEFVAKLEDEGVKEYQVSGPTIEDVFLKVAEEVNPDLMEESSVVTPQVSTVDEKKVANVAIAEKGRQSPDSSPQLVTGKRITMPRQAWVLFRKRVTILRRNYLPYCAAFLFPVIAAGLVTLYLNNFTRPSCTPADAQFISDIISLASQTQFDLVAGPSNRLSIEQLTRFGETLPGGGKTGNANLSALLDSVHMVDSLDQFNDYVHTKFANVTPGGFYLGDQSSPPTFVWKGNADISLAAVTQNALDVVLTNVSISCQYQSFDIPWAPGEPSSTFHYFLC